MDESIIESFKALHKDRPIKIVYSQWVQKMNKYGQTQKRVVVLGDFSLYTLKVKLGSPPTVTIQRQDHLYNLLEIKVSEVDVSIWFPDFHLKVTADQMSAVELVQILYKEYGRITNYTRDKSAAKFTGRFQGKDMLTSISHGPTPRSLKEAGAAGFAYRFDAACKFCQAEPSVETRQRLLDTICGLDDPNHNTKLAIDRDSYIDIDTVTILALAKALFYGIQRLTDIRIRNIALLDHGAIAVLQTLVRWPEVRIVELYRVGATIKSVPMLRSFLTRESGVDCFDFSDNDLNEAGMLLVADVVAKWEKPLPTLNVRKLHSTNMGTYKLAQSLLANTFIHTSLVKLDLSSNTIAMSASEFLTRYFLAPTCMLESIGLSNCQIAEDGNVAQVIVAAAQSAHMIAINVSHNAFSNETGLALCGAIAESTTLESVDISFLKVSPRVIEAICAAALMTSKTAMYLNVSGNNVGEVVGEKIASLLPLSAALRGFKGDNCKLGFIGLTSMCKGATGGNITSLSMSANVLDDEGRDQREVNDLAEALSALVNDTKNLKALAMADNSSPRATFNVNPMLSALQEGRSVLQSLDIQGNDIGDEGIASLAAALKTNTTLTEIDIDHNNTKVGGFELLEAAINANSTVTRLPFPERDFKIALASVMNKDGLRKLSSRIEQKLAMNLMDKTKATGSSTIMPHSYARRFSSGTTLASTRIFDPLR